MSNLLKLRPLIANSPMPPPMYNQSDTNVIACLTLINKIIFKNH
jgi:hypothetical protein